MKQPIAFIALCCSAAVAAGAARLPRIQVIPRELAPRVDVLVGDKPYTAYVYMRSLPHPALGPVHAASGAVAAGEALWFLHGDVNGLDFTSGGPEETAHRGRVVHRRVIEAASSDAEGQLGVETTWLGPGDALVMIDDTRFVFRDAERVRVVDRLTRLSAVRGAVRLARNGKGITGVRLADGFASPRAAVLGARGTIERAAVPAARTPWIAIEGFAGPERITVALMDHPRNPGFPNQWRLAEPGLLEIVPASDAGIEAGRSLTLRHRLVVFPGHAGRTAIESRFQDFSEGR